MHDLSLYLLEVLENSTRAGATRVDIELVIDRALDELRLAVDDDGGGLAATPEQTLDPFYTTKPGKKTGLGLSMLRADAQAAEGDLVVGASPSLPGTRVEAFMRFSHVDRPPLGDMATTILVTALTNPDVEFTVSLSGDEFVPPLEHAAPAEAAVRLQRETKELVGRNTSERESRT
jgi:signal transduction histidine kinase